MPDAAKPWTQPMPEEQFALMRDILAAPSPIGMEGALTEGAMLPYLERHMPASWKVHRFRGNAGLVVDTKPDDDDAFKVMVVGHADKIRLQVRSIGPDGKIWVNSDSFLPSTLIGHEVRLFSEDPDQAGTWRVIDGGTIEAIGAIHFAPPELKSGKRGIRADMLYLELQMYGEDPKAQIEGLGIKTGDTILLKRDIRRGFSPRTFYGAYLDNGLGCFLVTEVLRLLAERGGPKNVRFLGAAAAYEEIGRFGSRVLARQFEPDVLVGVDVAHDFTAAPGIQEKRMPEVQMGGGCTVKTGSITSAWLNGRFREVARELDIPIQPGMAGRDTGTDAMAAVFAAVDSAATSIGFPIRNMHTISECGHTDDILGAIHLVTGFVEHLDAMHGGSGCTTDDLVQGHPRLDQAGAGPGL